MELKAVAAESAIDINGEIYRRRSPAKWERQLKDDALNSWSWVEVKDPEVITLLDALEVK